MKGGFFTAGGLDSSLVTDLSLSEYKNTTNKQPFSIAFTSKSVDGRRGDKMVC